MTVTLLVLTACVAVVDWVAVQLRLFRIEYVFKPATLALLIGATAVADIGVAKPWLLVGLAFGLLGDVALMLSNKERTDIAFLVGLGSFLVGHIGYIVGFVRVGVRGVDLVAGVLVVIGLFGLVMPRVVRGALHKAGREFAALVCVYGAAVGTMTVCAVGTGLIAPAIGGVLFAMSDSAIGFQRFVRKVAHGDLFVIVTYHAAQYLFVVGLIRSL